MNGSRMMDNEWQTGQIKQQLQHPDGANELLLICEC